MGSLYEVNGTTGQLKVESGTVSLPGYSFLSETNSGWYRTAAGRLGLAIGGVNYIDVDSNTSSVSLRAENFTFGTSAGAFNDTIVLTAISSSYGNIAYVPSVAPHAWLFRSTGNTTYLYISESGAIGINKATFPQGQLDVFGAVYLSNSANAFLNIQGDSNQIVFGSANTITLNSPAPAANRIYRIPDVSANADFVMTEGNQTINGTKTFTGLTVTFGDGTAALPSIAFTSALNTGIYQPSTHVIGFSSNGTEIASIGTNFVIENSTSLIKVPDGSVSNPSIAFTSDTTTGIAKAGGGIQIVSGGTNGLAVFSTGAQADFRDGSAGSPSITFNSDSSTGFYRSAASTIAMSLGGTDSYNFLTGSFRPAGDATQDLGSGSAHWRNIYTSGGQIYLPAGTVSVPSIAFEAHTSTGIFNPSSSDIGFTNGGTQTFTINSGGIYPGSDNTETNGNSSLRWATTYSNTFYAGDGSSTVPTYTFKNDTTTGFAFGGGHSILFVCNGVQTAFMDAARLGLIDGTAVGPSYAFSSDLGTGMYRGAASNLRFATGGTGRIEINNAGNLNPIADNTNTCGASGQRWSDLYAVTVHSGDVAMQNDWRITEGEKIGHPEEGIMFLSPSGKKYKILMQEVE